VGKYKDVAGFCKSATTAEIATHGYVLTPGRYVGAEEVEDDGEPFGEKMARLVALPIRETPSYPSSEELEQRESHWHFIGDLP
jgi:type I restriction enzyme M protein